MLVRRLTKSRLDSFDPVTEISHLGAKRVKARRFRKDVGATPKRDLPKVILREPEGARDRRESSPGALTVNALLDLSQRGRRDPRALCEFALADLPLAHPVVDHLSDRAPVAHFIPSLTTA
jgi:hypothetical protein